MPTDEELGQVGWLLALSYLTYRTAIRRLMDAWKMVRLARRTPCRRVGGGAGDLEGQSGGACVLLDGADASFTVGQPHRKLLLDLVECMGAGSGSYFQRLLPRRRARSALSEI